jgi:hypothetical protein
MVASVKFTTVHAGALPVTEVYLLPSIKRRDLLRSIHFTLRYEAGNIASIKIRRPDRSIFHGSAAAHICLEDSLRAEGDVNSIRQVLPNHHRGQSLRCQIPAQYLAIMMNLTYVS